MHSYKSKETETYKALRTVVNFFIVLGIANMTYLIKWNKKNDGERVCRRVGRLVQAVVCIAVTVAATGVQVYFYGSRIVDGFYKNLHLLRHKDQLIASDGVKKVITQFIYFIFLLVQMGFFWYKAKELKNHLIDIQSYDVLYTQTIGKITRPLTNKKTTRFMCIVTIYGFVSGITYWELHLKEPFSVEKYYRCDDLMRMYTDSLWYLLCNAIRNYANQLRTDFMMDFKNDRLDDKFRHYILLRSRLAELTLGIRRVAGKMLALHALLEFFLIAINHYYVAYRLRELMTDEKDLDKGIDKITNLLYVDFDVFYFLAYILLKIYFCVDMAHHAERQMGDQLKLDLLSEISELQLSAKYEKVAQLKRFLKKVILTPADIRISRNIIINRSTFSLIFFWSFYCTFIVLQFNDALTMPRTKELESNITSLSSQLDKYDSFVETCFHNCPLVKQQFCNITINGP